MKFKDAIEFKDVIIEKDLHNEIVPEVVFSCNHCKRPSGYDTLEGIDKHLDLCLFKNDNKRCLMCKHLKLQIEAPYPRNHKMWGSVDTEWGFGNYNTPICMKSDKPLTEEQIHTYNGDCFELGEEEPVMVHSEEYTKYLEISDDVHEEWKVEEK